MNLYVIVTIYYYQSEPNKIVLCLRIQKYAFKGLEDIVIEINRVNKFSVLNKTKILNLHNLKIFATVHYSYMYIILVWH